MGWGALQVKCVAVEKNERNTEDEKRTIIGVAHAPRTSLLCSQDLAASLALKRSERGGVLHASGQMKSFRVYSQLKLGKPYRKGLTFALANTNLTL